jgi:hypothetical protein
MIRTNLAITLAALKKLNPHPNLNPNRNLSPEPDAAAVKNKNIRLK